MAIDRHRTLRGALAGGVAAGVWFAAPRLRVPTVLRGPLAGLAAGLVARRLSPPEAPVPPVDEAAVASNGHGSAEHLVASGPVDR
jgi:hypothetical protein